MSFFRKKKLIKNAQKMAQSLQRTSYQNPPKKNTKKKTFLIAPVSLKASIALEASFAIPLFFAFFVHIISAVYSIGFQSRLESSLFQYAKEMAVNGYVYQKANLSSIVSFISVQDVQHKINRELKKEYYKVSLLSSKVMENDRIDLIAHYKVEPLINILPFIEIPAYARCSVKPWTGYDLEKGSVAENLKERYVFITEKGSVYHQSRNCNILDLSISKTDGKMVSALRNKEGAKYYPCEICSSGLLENDVYITEYGNRYHCYLGCSKLKRTIKAILLSETEGKLPCQKCKGDLK